jgi:ABC-2 type transport system permease protein
MSPAFRAVLRKEVRQVTRDPRMLPMLLVAPAVQLTIFGYAVNLDVDRVATVVCDVDDTPESRALVRGLLADGTFRGVGAARDCARPGDDVRDDLAKVAVVLPRGLGRDLAQGRPAEVQVLVDGTNPVVGRYASTAAAAYFEQAGLPWLRPRLEQLRALQEREVAMPSLAVQARLLYNPRMKTAIFMVPGVSAMLLLLVTTIVTSMGLAREREVGTLEQVMVTPIRPAELILGKVLPFVIVGLFDVLFALVVGAYLFDVPIRGSLLLLALGTLLYLMSTVGLGLFISTVSRSQQQAFMVSFFIVMPAFLLSGVVSPIENMPGWLQPVTWVNPVRYYVEILRGVLLKGADAQDLGRSLVALFGFGLGILGLAVARFRKRLS